MLLIGYKEYEGQDKDSSGILFHIFQTHYCFKCHKHQCKVIATNLRKSGNL